MHWIKPLSGLTLISLFTCAGVHAQDLSDRCHVYLADQSAEAAEAIEKLIEEVADPHELEKRMAEFVKILGEFDTTVREEHATTKSYRIPGTAQFVTVTVFYTDESMISESAGPDSMLLSLVMADRPLDTALGVPESVQAEVSVGMFAGKLRVKKVTVLDRKEYLIGLECDRKASSARRQ